jgi:hypothetical protein
MTRWTGRTKKPRTTWQFTVQDNGTVSFALWATRLRPVAKRGRAHFELAELVKELRDIPLVLSGSRCHPKLTFILNAKMIPQDAQRAIWGEVRKLSGRKRQD